MVSFDFLLRFAVVLSLTQPRGLGRGPAGPRGLVFVVSSSVVVSHRLPSLRLQRFYIFENNPAISSCTTYSMATCSISRCLFRHSAVLTDLSMLTINPKFSVSSVGDFIILVSSCLSVLVLLFLCSNKSGLTRTPPPPPALSLVPVVWGGGGSEVNHV